jgi:hypothetical protein
MSSIDFAFGLIVPIPALPLVGNIFVWPLTKPVPAAKTAVNDKTEIVFS